MNRWFVRVALSSLSVITAAQASDVQVADVRTERTEAGEVCVLFTISWENAWRDDVNHDAVWLFCRLDRGGAPGSLPLRLTTAVGGDFRTTAGALRSMDWQSSDDSLGLFVKVGHEYRGDAYANLRIGIDSASAELMNRFPDATVQVHAIEMVYVPEGPFTLGDPDSASIEFGAFYASNDDGEPVGLIRLESENAIDIGPHEGELYYKVEQPQYQGDQSGPIPAEFPKGTRGFYVMKYEITQGQYAAFLNSLDNEATAFRAPQGKRDYYDHRGSIRLVGGEYVADAPARPANMLSWDDGCAFADWAGLRPMTELEFTKACRGPSEPIAREYPWNTASQDRLLRVVGPADDLVTTGEADESLLTQENRDVFGASYYGVMDLAGSVWEKCVTIGHPAGRAFAGSHGDGRLSYGSATNSDWPRGDNDGGGYGYRGGGFYEQGRVYEPDHFNPYSPIAWRRFGAWGAGPRSVAYGMRCARTAD
jgi:formylglycine-generating enzyme required for sulfatase activity